ncbi:uncharacterized protein BDZ99DRAFT_572984 [Mytilinidion resinicola]|uniref:Uncharacterized protein n=1 Tax=Mytilinidion resinicola TaxID=574789 RepID=A0A6A6YGE5_9PEZI|nr:uncharacterized protein BDZ99DRAFT_572984 [Mytilinidion resinicola]KAF2807084.1 hypothetical protein BDZ99DRAFT_572984 [Mytilinidion resinicola]
MPSQQVPSSENEASNSAPAQIQTPVDLHQWRTLHRQSFFGLIETLQNNLRISDDSYRMVGVRYHKISPSIREFAAIDATAKTEIAEAFESAISLDELHLFEPFRRAQDVLRHARAAGNPNLALGLTEEGLNMVFQGQAQQEEFSGRIDRLSNWVNALEETDNEWAGNDAGHAMVLE